MKKSEFIVRQDFVKRGTFAKNIETNEEKQIAFSGYISNDLSVRKAISAAFGCAGSRTVKFYMDTTCPRIAL